MRFREQTATMGDVVGKESRGGGFPRLSHLRGEWRGGALISELKDISEVSNDRGKISHSPCPLDKW